MKEKIFEIIVLIFIIAIISTSIILIKDNIKGKSVIAQTTVNDDTDYNNDAIVTVTDIQTVDETYEIQEEEKIVIKKDCVGVVVIPSIDVRAQIKVGTDSETIKNYVGMFESSASFGSDGNVSLAAHNNVYTEIFKNLHKVENGELVRIITKDMEYTYKVVSKSVVEPTDTSVIKSNGKKELTLITCNSNASKRIVVKCDYISAKSL